MIAIHDPDLPGLNQLDTNALRRITGAEDVSIKRFRYREGKRAILHLSTEAGEGSAWFFQGDKARRLARRNKRTARYDAPSEAMYETFPDDHRMPQIRAFLDDYDRIAPDLIGATPSGTPELVRYRPGLSCTFRCHLVGGGAVFVKLINDDSPARLAEMNRQMVSHLTGSPVSVAPILGFAPDYDAIAYASAAGLPLDAELAKTGDASKVSLAIGALRNFWRLSLTPSRHLTAEVLRKCGAESAELTILMIPAASQAAKRILARLEANTPYFNLRPIHADMKLEHLFIDESQMTLIDTESVSLGPTDYDLAQLYGRLWQAELEGQLPRDLVEQTTRTIRREAGDSFGWCLDVVALRLAKFYAQRPTVDATEKIGTILDRLS